MRLVEIAQAILVLCIVPFGLRRSPAFLPATGYGIVGSQINRLAEPVRSANRASLPARRCKGDATRVKVSARAVAGVEPPVLGLVGPPVIRGRRGEGNSVHRPRTVQLVDGVKLHRAASDVAQLHLPAASDFVFPAQ